MIRIYYYLSPSGKNPVATFINSVQKPEKKKIFKIFGYIEKYGLPTVFPHTKKLTNTPFWEIRVLGKNNTRIIYAVVYKGDVLVLHGFIKKTQQTPIKHIEISIRRYNDWKGRQEKRS